ncbi:MAG: VWA domain-containing protein, partial [Bacteroidota bacterium]
TIGKSNPQNRIPDLNLIFAYVEAEMGHQHEIRGALEQGNQHLLKAASPGQMRGGAVRFVFPPQPKASELEASYRVALQEAAGGRFGSALRRLYGMSRELEELLQQLSALEDPASASSGMELLAEIEQRFDEIVALEDQLGREGDKWIQEKLSEESPWYEAQSALMRVSLQARRVGKALRSGEVEQVRKAVADLKAEHQKHVQAQVQHLHALAAQPGSQRDPQHRFQACLKQSAALISFVEEYVAGAGSHPPFQAYPPAYYCYHQRWGKKFDAFDQGLRGQIGQFLALEKAEEILPLSQPVWWEFLPVQWEPKQETGPRQVVLVVDRSGSMRQSGKLELLRKNFQSLIETLSETDRIAMVSYSDAAQLEMNFATPADSQQLLGALEKVQVGGNSLPGNGIELALDLLDTAEREDQQHAPQPIIVMLTDGGFQIGHPLLRKISAISDKDIQFRLFYLGRDELHMRKRLRGLAAYANGTYQYLNPQTASRQLAHILQ